MPGLTLAAFFSILPLSFSLAASDALAITFDDGLTHVIDVTNSFPLASPTEVRNGPGPTVTTLFLLDGGCPGCDPDFCHRGHSHASAAWAWPW